MLTVETDEDYDKNQKALLEEKFKSLEQCPQKYIKAYENFLSTPDTPENLATIGRITLADLPLKVEDYKCDKKVLDNGTTLVSYPVSTKGIVYVHMAIDVKNLCLEDRILLPVLIRLIQMCGTKTMDYSTLSNRIRFLTGGFIIYQNYGLNVHKKVVSQIIIRTKMLQSDFEEGLSLIKDLFLNGDFSDSGRIKASITDIITEFESNYLYSGNAYGSISATATLSSTMYDSEITMGTSSWLKAEEIKKELGDDEKKWVAFGKTLEKLRNKVFTSKALLFHLGCSKETVKDNENIAINFSKAFPVGKAIRTNVFFKNLPNLPKERVYTVSSSPAFNVLAIKLDNMTEKQKVQGTLLSSILSYGWLWNEVRGKGGAYGVEANYGNKESIFVMSSYRDPSISETYKTYKKALKSQFTKEEMEYAVVTMIGKELKPLTTQGKCSESFSRYVYGNSTAMYLRRRRLLLKVTLKDLESIGRIISKAIDEGKYAKVTVCGKDMLKEDKDKVFIAHSRALPI
ncbi:MAG: hypothetical protein HUK24_03245 [Sphaerochaetaceae bacterium]|nr:hypothetical protein [Sphaerochaetaceae bacterium]